MRTPRRIIAIVCLLAVLKSATFGAEPDSRPIVPDLVVGGESSKSFVIEGILRPNESAGLGFQVVCDGKKQLACMYSVAEGVPMLISDGESTLLYDFGNKRILLLRNSYCYGGIKKNDTKDSLLYNFSFKSKNEEENSKILGPEFQLQKILNIVEEFKSEVGVDGIVTYSSSSKPFLTLKLDPQKKHSFKFAHTVPDTELPLLELEARLINQPIPAELFKFSDYTKFSQKLNVVDHKPGEGVDVAARDFADFKFFYVKVMLAVNADEMQLKSIIPDESLAELRKRDAEFGKIYRQALADQGIVMPVDPKLAAGKKEAKSK